MGSQSRQHLAMDAQTRQAEALERIANALERLAGKFAPAGTVNLTGIQVWPGETAIWTTGDTNGEGT